VVRIDNFGTKVDVLVEKGKSILLPHHKGQGTERT